MEQVCVVHAVLQVGAEIKFACVDGPEFDGHLVDFDQSMKTTALCIRQKKAELCYVLQKATHTKMAAASCGGN